MSGNYAGRRYQGAANLIGLFLVKAGAALIDHMAILFAVGVGVSVCQKRMTVPAESQLLHHADAYNTSFNRFCYDNHAIYR